MLSCIFTYAVVEGRSWTTPNNISRFSFEINLQGSLESRGNSPGETSCFCFFLSLGDLE